MALPFRILPPPILRGNTVGASTTPSAPALPAETQYEVINGHISANGQAIKIHGINWFGFETPTHVVHGLWERRYTDLIKQIKDLGFNAVRLPISSETLAHHKIGYVNSHLNPEFKGQDSLAALDLIIQECDRQGLYILADWHVPEPSPKGDIPELWHTPDFSEHQWLDDLKFLAGHYKGVAHFLGIDLKNEPHGQATWGDGNPATDWKLAAEKAAEVILQTSPNILIFVEGVQKNTDDDGSTQHWWGGNLEEQAVQPIKIPKNKLVFSPHVFGPDLYEQRDFKANNFPINMEAVWERDFGYLTDLGYAVAIGEFGGRYLVDSNGKVWQQAFATYLKKKHLDFFYWSFNPNSAHGEGLLTHHDGQPDDWKTIDQAKYASLQTLLQ